MPQEELSLSTKIPDDKKPCQHIGSSQDQVFPEDEAMEQEKMGGNHAAAVPVSGARQMKPHLRDGSLKK